MVFSSLHERAAPKGSGSSLIALAGVVVVGYVVRHRTGDEVKGSNMIRQLPIAIVIAAATIVGALAPASLAFGARTAAE